MSETTLEFITLRQPERIRQKLKRLRYIRDLRTDAQAPFRQQLIGTDNYLQKVVLARTMIEGPLFFSAERYYQLQFETVTDTLRSELRGPVHNRDGSTTEGVELASIIALLEDRIPALATSNFFHDPVLPPPALLVLFLEYSVIWESLYAVCVMAGIHQVETNHHIDAIRGMHLLTLVRLENLKPVPPITWPYYDFDAYEATLPKDLLSYDNLA
ncbi:hypothetical protein [uncultured Roseobacter sp.]|uniref:hypothetical protein n=1 Tax=uncultured Roseobacter sp. TaxID=114847 RepID=UPI0026274838|nr:hypothetical protein [uncultured Roseobacter sp.]